MAEVLYRGSKVFWKVHSTVDVIIVKHAAEKVLEVICIDPIMTREAARLYLRLPLLLKHFSKEDTQFDQSESCQDDFLASIKVELTNFVIKHLHVTAHKAKSRTFQIEFQNDSTDFECAPPSKLIPFNVQAPSTARKEAVKEIESSTRSNASSSTLSVSRSSTQRTDTKGREEFVEFTASIKATPVSILESENNSSPPKLEANKDSPDAPYSAGAAILNRSYAASEPVRTNSQTCLPFSSKNNAPLIRTNSDPTTKEEVHEAPVTAITARLSPRSSPRPRGNISPTSAAANANVAAGLATPRPYVKARRRSSVHATSTVLQALPQDTKELAPLPSNRLAHVDTLHAQMTYTTHPTNPPQHALTHTPTSHIKSKPHKTQHKSKNGLMSAFWCGGAGSSVNSVHPQGPRPVQF